MFPLNPSIATADRDLVLARLGDRMNRPAGVRAPYAYLDPEAVLYLFQDLTGLDRPPGHQTDDQPGESNLRGRSGREAPLHLVYEAMLPVIEKQVPLIRCPEDLTDRVHHYARVEGVIGATRFPDGGLNHELLFVGLRGLLFFTPEFFSSLMRPLLSSDRLHGLAYPAEALVYVQGPVTRLIFYHQSYGDNREHDWLPLVPVVVRKVQA